MFFFYSKLLQSTWGLLKIALRKHKTLWGLTESNNQKNLDIILQENKKQGFNLSLTTKYGRNHENVGEALGKSTSQSNHYTNAIV